jgi:hypothetical protein
VSWRHRIAVVLLTVLAALPVSGTVCTLMCDSSSWAAAAGQGPHAHHSSPGEPAATDSSTGPQIGGNPEHDCSTHDGAIRQATTTPAERADLTAKSAPVTIGAIHIESVSLRDSQAFVDYSSPPGTAPPTTTPLVLRV